MGQSLSNTTGCSSGVETFTKGRKTEPDLYSLLKPPNIYLLMGCFLFSVAVFSTFTGKVSARFCWVYRAKEPTTFWFVVATYYLAGTGFIGYFLYRVYGLSN